jgi:hypothetical protein
MAKKAAEKKNTAVRKKAKTKVKSGQGDKDDR